MANEVIMKNTDTVIGKMGSCYITIDGNRYNFLQAKDIEATIEKTKQKVEKMGNIMVGHRTTAGEGKGSAKFHYNTSIFREMVLKYVNSGEDVYFDMQITNDDPTSNTGRQTVILKDCNMDSVLLAKIVSDDSLLEDTFDFTFDSASMPESFNSIDGMV